MDMEKKFYFRNLYREWIKGSRYSKDKVVNSNVYFLQGR